MAIIKINSGTTVPDCINNSLCTVVFALARQGDYAIFQSVLFDLIHRGHIKFSFDGGIISLVFAPLRYRSVLVWNIR